MGLAGRWVAPCRGERVLLDQLRHAAGAPQTIWLTEKLAELYTHALAHNGDVSVGKGSELYNALVKMLLRELQHDDRNHRKASIDQLLSVYLAADKAGVQSAPQDLIKFARDQLPGALKQQLNDYHAIVSSTAINIAAAAGCTAMPSDTSFRR